MDFWVQDTAGFSHSRIYYPNRSHLLNSDIVMDTSKYVGNMASIPSLYRHLSIYSGAFSFGRSHFLDTFKIQVGFKECGPSPRTAYPSGGISLRRVSLGIRPHCHSHSCPHCRFIPITFCTVHIGTVQPMDSFYPTKFLLPSRDREEGGVCAGCTQLSSI